MNKKIEILKPVAKESNHNINFSGFFLLINLQQSIRNKNDPLIKKFHDVVLYLVKNIWSFIKILDGASLNNKSTFPENIKITPKIEIGTELSRLHTHLIITLNHHSKIQLDLEKIRKYLRDALELQCRGSVNTFK